MLFYTSGAEKSLNPTQNLSQIYLKFYWSWKSLEQLTCHHHEDLPRRKRHTKSFSYEIDLLVTWHFLLKSMNLMIHSQIWSRKIPKGGNWDVFFVILNLLRFKLKCDAKLSDKINKNWLKNFSKKDSPFLRQLHLQNLPSLPRTSLLNSNILQRHNKSHKIISQEGSKRLHDTNEGLALKEFRRDYFPFHGLIGLLTCLRFFLTFLMPSRKRFFCDRDYGTWWR